MAELTDISAIENSVEGDLRGLQGYSVRRIQSAARLREELPRR